VGDLGEFLEAYSCVPQGLSDGLVLQRSMP
jgi:hypothetical protein